MFVISSSSPAADSVPEARPILRPIVSDYFDSPLHIPILLAGNFAEMRTDHFHSGIDIKTNNRTGYRVYAAADGWVSRIKVSPTGYGNALYIDHPNGFTTVYAHLDRFEEPIASFVLNRQYARERFAQDFSVKKGVFPFHKGDIIGMSGNSGSSSGPHLHFEIRDTETEEPVNPLLFGIPVEDTRPPKIYRVKIYAADRASVARVRFHIGTRRATYDNPLLLSVENVGGANRLAGVSEILASGRIGFGIQTNDFHNGSNSRLGAYRISLLAGADTLYRSEMRRFSFSDSRQINAHVDYAERLRNRRWVQRSFLLPGNHLPLYHVRHRGWLSVMPDSVYAMKYQIDDAAGNETALTFDVVGSEEPVVATNGHVAPDMRIRWTRASKFNRDGIRVTIPPYTLYQDLDFHFGMSPRDEKSYSPYFNVHDPFTPVQGRYSLALDAGLVPAGLRDKAIVVVRDADGDDSSVGGKVKDGWIKATPREFGTFYIALDTLPPVINPVNIRDGKNMARASSIRLHIEDEDSGIDTYAGYVDGRWQLFSYDAKRDRIEYVFDEHVSRGEHTLLVVVTDEVGNVSRYEAHFTR